MSVINHVKITFSDGQVFTLTPKEFQEIGYSPGLCKKYKLLIKNIEQIDFGTKYSIK